MRKLASIQTIQSLAPIPNADAIEQAQVLGWRLVVKKGEFQVGDRVVYCEIDSLLPERPEFEFLRPSCFKPEIRRGEELVRPAGFRIKTIRLRGQVSQGICFPLTVLPQGAEVAVGDDVTELLGVQKFEVPPPTNMSGRVKGSFPGFLDKTDETRVQLLGEVLERHRGKKFYVTEKVDGSSFTAFLREGEFGVCSRNLHLDETDASNVMVQLAERLELCQKLEQIQQRHGFQPAIQGELLGPGVQGNKYALAEHDLYVFTIVDIGAGRWIERVRMLEILEEVGLKAVPQLETLTLDHGIDELVEMAVGKSALRSQTQREGIVLRTMSEEHDPELGRLSFKAISPKFLLKYDE